MRMLHVSSLSECVPAPPFDILEPSPAYASGQDREECGEGPLDLVLMPGLAFGADGARLGRGGGYYDAFIQRVNGVADREVRGVQRGPRSGAGCAGNGTRGPSAGVAAAAAGGAGPAVSGPPFRPHGRPRLPRRRPRHGRRGHGVHGRGPGAVGVTPLARGTS